MSGPRINGTHFKFWLYGDPLPGPRQRENRSMEAQRNDYEKHVQASLYKIFRASFYQPLSPEIKLKTNNKLKLFESYMRI